MITLCITTLFLVATLGFIAFLGHLGTTVSSEEQMNTSTTQRNQLPPVPEDYYNGNE